MLIDCDTCAVRGPACGDCVVTVLLGAPPAAVDVPAAPPVDLDQAEQAAIAVLAGSGLVPPLRLVPVEEAAGPAADPTDPADRRPAGQRAAQAGDAGPGTARRCTPGEGGRRAAEAG